jgi:hypothetical protein
MSPFSRKGSPVLDFIHTLLKQLPPFVIFNYLILSFSLELLEEGSTSKEPFLIPFLSQYLLQYVAHRGSVNISTTQQSRITVQSMEPVCYNCPSSGGDSPAHLPPANTVYEVGNYILRQHLPSVERLVFLK